MLKKKKLPRAKPMGDVNWSQSPEKIAFDIWKLQPNYSFELARSFEESKEDYFQDWYMTIYSQVLAVLSNDKYRRTASTICIFSRRKLSNAYRDKHVRLCRMEPEKLAKCAHFGNATAAKIYNTWLSSNMEDDEDNAGI